ncbi:MAG: hypothetical protein WCG44_00375 [bacterium]
MKKSWIIISIFIFTLATFGVLYLFNSVQPSKHPVSTGGDRPQQVPISTITESDAMEKLSKLLPLKTTNFSIVFDYKKGKYLVTKTDSGVDLQSKFDKWYESSSYKAIPKTRFLLIK